MTDLSTAIRAINHAIEGLNPQRVSTSQVSRITEWARHIPRTTDSRLQASLSDEPTSLFELRNDESKKEKTYLYLGYGSNMANLTFLVRRGIRPLSQVNVVVPSIQMTFDLAGLPYLEPCFANMRYRDDASLPQSQPQEKDNKNTQTTTDYHKDRWHKGLVGVVYEVTASDYAHIIETEGGGASYGDILVDCHALSADPSEPVPLNPTTTAFKSHTLFSQGTPASRPNPSYAQPSARYLSLLTTGARERNLPTEYRTYLSQIRPYQTTTSAQELGRVVFMATWGPLFAFVFLGGGKTFVRPDGTYPSWYAKMVLALFAGVWASYDNWFKPMFGDGERSIVNGGSAPDGGEAGRRQKQVQDFGYPSEKMPFLDDNLCGQQWAEPGTERGDEMV